MHVKTFFPPFILQACTSYPFKKETLIILSVKYNILIPVTFSRNFWLVKVIPGYTNKFTGFSSFIALKD
jgi:hypothetical protein